jgi:hypothetical protein
MDEFYTEIEASTSPTYTYPAALPKDLALFPNKTEDVLAYYKISVDRFLEIQELPTFKRELSTWQKRVQEDSYGVTAKAEVLVSQGLTDLQELMFDPTTTPSTKLEIQKYFAALAGLTNKKEAQAPATQANTQTRLVISWANGENQIALENISNATNINS